MRLTKTYYLSRGDEEEIELLVVYSATPIIPQTWEQPAEGGEIEVEEVTGPDGDLFDLTDEEREKLETYLAENLDDADFDDDPNDY